jgi:hypothetical protein
MPTLLLERSSPVTPTYLQTSYASDEVHCVTPYTHSGSFHIRLDPSMLEFGHVSNTIACIQQETYGCTAHPSEVGLNGGCAWRHGGKAANEVALRRELLSQQMPNVRNFEQSAQLSRQAFKVCSF